MGKIDTIIFDLDGTLLDTLEDLTSSVNYALQKCGMPLHTIEEIKNFVGNGVRVLMVKSVPCGEQNPRFEEAFSIFKEHYAIHCNDKTKAYDGVTGLLEELKSKGYALAIVSNKIDSAVQELKEKYFSAVTVAIGDREGIKRKPEPDSVLLALKELGKTRSSAIYVGDSEVDLKTAENSQLACISVLWGFRDKEFLLQHNAKLFAEKPYDIINIVDNYTAQECGKS